jgi:hypothetical protein
MSVNRSDDGLDEIKEAIRDFIKGKDNRIIFDADVGEEDNFRIKIPKQETPRIRVKDIRVPKVKELAGEGIGDMPQIKIKSAKMTGIKFHTEDMPSLGKMIREEKVKKD